MRGETYEQFVEKFKHKKTTDDCYTPPVIYNVVKQWACEKYNIDSNNIVRPFYPGGDYENYEYPKGCTVLDNPPFSILSKICAFYLERDIPFFLFAPSLTAFSGRNIVMKTNHIICGTGIVYENGAVVNTSFITSYGDDVVAQTAPDLHAAIKAAMQLLKKKRKKSFPKYEYPDNVITAAMIGKYSAKGVNLSIKRSDCVLISRLDAQTMEKKTIFGGGLLLSDMAAATHAEARAAVQAEARAAVQAEECAESQKWELSDREHAIIARLNCGKTAIK